MDLSLFDWREAAAALLDSRWAMAWAVLLIGLVWLLLDATT